jgi:hypothetical protein
MSPLDFESLATDEPRTTDGRVYPPHLRVYERYDRELLPLILELGSATFDDLSIRIADPKVRSVLPRWLASAQWRGLVQRNDGTPRTFVSGPKASDALADAA